MVQFLLSWLLPALVAASQPAAPRPVPAPLRDLQWGGLNFLHTTDTHGWHAGHLEQASYAGDWGDYISFAHHMRRIADDQGRDLLVVDTGDRVEGNGLYDASDPKGKYTFDIIKHQDIDVLCSGNHELYKKNSSENEFNKTVPSFKGHYLASNIDIHNPVDGHVEPLAQRFRKFKTKNQGLTITAFGFLYNFKGNDKNTIVKPVEHVVEEQWFIDAIHDKDTDLFLVTGHIAADAPEIKTIFNAIRKVKWDTPIQFFAGHTHIRDFRRFDKASTALESGRYMETLGFLSIDGIVPGKRSSNVQFNRRYIDNNLFSMYHHTGLNDSKFPTPLGLNVSAQISEARTKLKLDKRHGCAPHDLWMDRVGIDDDASIFKWLREHVLPDQFGRRKSSQNPLLALANTGAIRFDIFKGPFTVDSAFLISPFTSAFRQIRDVDFRVAAKLLNLLNSNGQVLATAGIALDVRDLVSPEQLAARRSESTINDRRLHAPQVPLDISPALVPGYITHDDDGSEGDDTEHAPLPFVRTPNCVESRIGFPADGTPERVDVVYNEYIEPWIIKAFQFLGAGYNLNDTTTFLHGESMTDVISDWVREHWPCHGDEL